MMLEKIRWACGCKLMAMKEYQLGDEIELPAKCPEHGALLYRWVGLQFNCNGRPICVAPGDKVSVDRSRVVIDVT